jgi:predicted MFS family arabinose efflux permease
VPAGLAHFGVQPVGAVLGGALGTAFGLHAALLAAAAINVVAFATLVASPLREAREVPASAGQ